MNPKLLFSFVMLTMVFLSSCSQIVLKKTALKEYPTWLKFYFNPAVMGAYTVFFLTTLINVYALKYVPLSLSAILETTSYIYIPLLSIFFFKEHLSTRKWIGIIFILVGVIIFSL